MGDGVTISGLSDASFSADNIAGRDITINNFAPSISQLVTSDPETLKLALVRFEQLPTTSIPSPTLLPTPRYMPFQRNQNFVGRQEDLRVISKAIKTEIGAVAVVGMGG